MFICFTICVLFCINETLIMKQEYIKFLKEHADYAKFIGYNFSTERGIREAMADYFLYDNFLVEYQYEQNFKNSEETEQV